MEEYKKYDNNSGGMQSTGMEAVNENGRKEDFFGAF